MSFADDPAFPVQTVFGPDGYPHWGSNGMTKRHVRRYSDWAEEHEFPWFVGERVPDGWLDR